MKKARRFFSWLLLIAMLLPMLPTTALTVFANESTQKEDAMETIKADKTLNTYLVGETQHFDNDGYIGIPYEVTVYYDKETHGKATPGYVTLGATPVIVYVVNANFERIGTESDTVIIQSMIERGFAVVVLDYLNDERAKTPDLDYSVQQLRANKVGAGTFFTDEEVFQKGTYSDSLVVPAGYNVKFNDIFMELDKHGTDGTLERIVNVWNNDFRLYHKDVIVKWVHEDGMHKATQNGFNGSAPVWYSDASGKTADENGQYTKVQYTLAEKVTDCVKADGTPIDLNLYIHVIYPTSPDGQVPVMTMFSSSGYLMSGSSNATRPQFQSFLFNGYAGVLFDYAWIPMGRNDHYGYFDGSSGDGKSVTGDNQSYATYTYNSAQVATAAMRYTRYLALSEPDTYAFDIDALGVFGISKAAWMTQLGAPVLRENLYTSADGDAATVARLVNDKINGFYQQLILPEHHGETRYDNGLTESYTVDGFTVDGGELQPWAVWEGNEISSGAQMIYSSCGASVDYFTEGYSPQFITENLQDNYNTEYGKQNELVSLCRNHNIPALWFEADIAHTFAEGLDYRYGVDIYEAFRLFADYYLKHTPVSVTYTDPVNGAVIKTTDTITVKLIGDANADEIAKITLTDSRGNAVSGTWTSAYGDTEWTFLPDALAGGEIYTLTVPADFAGKNGKEMGKAYTATFYTRAEGDNTSVSGAGVLNTVGTPVSVTVPALGNANAFSLRVRVSNDAANLLSAYDAESGKLLCSVRVSGIGFYEIDLTDAIAERTAGETLNLILRTENKGENVLTYEEDFNSGRGDFTTSSYASYQNAQMIDGETALEIIKKTNYGKFGGDYWFYERGTVITNKKMINGGSAVTQEDMGRRFVFKIRLYDTVSRQIMLSLNSATSKADQRLDFDRVIYTEATVANGWSEYEIPYTVYEAKYGINQQKQFYLNVGATGDTEMPIYVDHFTVYEVFTDVAVSSVALVAHKENDHSVKAPVSENAFSVNGTEYATWKDAVNAATNGSTVTMLRNYTFTDSDAVNLGGKTSLTIDLGGYRLIAANTAKAPLWIGATNGNAMQLTLSNGSVILESNSLISWSGASASGNGKVVDILLDNIYLTHAQAFPMLSFFAEPSIANEAKVAANVTLADCVVDIDRDELPHHDVVIFGAGGGTLDINYTFRGGRLLINDLHDATIATAIVDTAANDAGESFEILVPVSEGTPVISYRKENGFAMPAQTGEENGYVIFTPADAKNTSEYGAIPDKYLDASLYPFVAFANDVCIGAATTINAASVLAKNFMTAKPGSTVALLARRDYACEKGTASLDNFNGTLILDLDGHTVTRNATIFEGMVTTDYKGGFDTKVVFKNGTVLLSNGHVIAFESKGNADKNYDILFDSLTFAVEAGASPAYIVSRCWSSGTANVYAKMTLTNCVFDFAGVTEGSSAPASAVTVFQMSNASVHADVHVVGGQILADGAAPANVTWTGFNAGSDSLVFDRDANGNYVTLTVPNGVTPEHALPTADGTFSFKTLVQDGDKSDVYTLTNDTVATEYGSIPAASSGKVFALFMDGKFVGAEDTWAAIQKLARTTLDAAPGKTVTILMRANHTHNANISTSDRIPFMKGNVVVDLGGKTLTAAKTVFECGTSGYTGNFDTSYTVKNGTILVDSGNFFASESRSSADKHIDLSFENVTIDISDTSTKNKLFLVYGDQSSNPGKVTFDLSFNGCTFDLRGYSASSFTVFDFGTSAANVAANITLTSGEFLADSVNTLSLIKGVENKDVLTFTAGNEPTLTEPNGAVLTHRGFIPGEYASETSYPFVLFGKDGMFVSAKAKWSEILGTSTGGAHKYLSSNKNSVCYVLVRTDYVKSDSGTTYLGRMMGTIVIDLDGHTMGRTAHSYLEAGTKSMTETEAGYVANVIIKNGKLYAGRSDTTGKNTWLITYQTYVNYDKTVNLTFDGVTFAVIAGQGDLNGIVAGSWGPSNSATGVLTSTITFRNCTFDFSGSEGTTVPSSTTLVKLDQGGDYLDVDVVFEGGKLVGTASGISLSKLTANDVQRFTKNSEGEYFAYDVTSTSGIPSASTAMTTDEGTMYFVRESFATVSGTRRYYYELGVKSDDCDGAVVPYMYYFNTEKYPYIIVQNGAFIGARETWNTATGLAIAYVDNDGDEKSVTTLYLLRDATDHTNGSRISGIRGKVIIDLNGYTLTTTKTLFEGKVSHACTSTVEVKNGTIVIDRTGNGSIIALECDAGNDFVAGSNKDVYLTFENVTFRYAEGATSTSPLVITWNGNSADHGSLTAYLTFNGCTFDMRAATVRFNLIHAANGGELLIVKTAINGGSILLPASNLVNWYPVSGEEDTLTLGTYNGAYPTLTLVNGGAPTTAFVTEEGNAYFYKDTSLGVYVLGIGRAQLTGASVSLGSCLSIYYYVKIHDESLLNGGAPSMTFTMNGKTVTVTTYETIGGEYVFRFDGIAPQQMADLVDAKFFVGDVEILSHTGYSVLKNCESLLSMTAAQLGMTDSKYAAMRTLVADLVAYGKAAQDYKDYDANGEIAIEGSTPSENLPTESDAMTVTGNTDASLHFTSATVRFDTVNSIVIKIYANVEDASLVTVRINGKDYKLSDLTDLGNGTYKLSTEGIKATNFDTVYTVELLYNGESVATLGYSVNAYAYAMSNGATQNAEMKALAETLYRYGVSADAYQNAQ